MDPLGAQLGVNGRKRLFRRISESPSHFAGYSRQLRLEPNLLHNAGNLLRRSKEQRSHGGGVRRQSHARQNFLTFPGPATTIAFNLS
jgi:hypothetical protein